MSSTQNKKLSMLAFVVVALSIAQVKSAHTQVSDQPSKVCSGQYVKATIGQDTKLYPIGGGKGSGQATCSPGNAGSSVGKFDVKANPDFDLGKNPYCVLGNANCVAVDDPITRTHPQVSDQPSKVCSGQHVKATIGQDTKLYPIGGGKGSGQATCSPGNAGSSVGKFDVKANPDFDLGKNPYCVLGNAQCVAVDDPITRTHPQVSDQPSKVCSGQHVKATIGQDTKLYPIGGGKGSGQATCSPGNAGSSVGKFDVKANPDFDLGKNPYCVLGNAQCVAVDDPITRTHPQVSDQPSKVCSGQHVKATIGQDTKLYPIGGGKGSGQATCSPGNAGSSVGKFEVKSEPDFDLGKNPYCVMANAQCVAVDDPITRTHPQVSDQPSKVCSGQYVKATIGQDTKLYPIGGGRGSGQATCSPGNSGSSVGKLEVKSNPDFDLGKNPYCVMANANCVAVDDPITRTHPQVSDQPSKVCSGQHVKATIGQDTKLYPIGGGKGSGQATCSPGHSGSSLGKFEVKSEPDFDLGKNPYCVLGNAKCVAVSDADTRNPDTPIIGSM